MKFQIHCADSPGVGHVYRSVALAIELRKRNHLVSVQTAENTIASKICAKYVQQTEIENPDWKIVDFPPERACVPEGRWCNLALTGDVTRDRLFSLANINVCQGIANYQFAGDQFVGFEYALLWPDLPRLRSVDKYAKAVFYYGSTWKHMKPIYKKLESQDFDLIDPTLLFSDVTKRNDEILAECTLAVTSGGMTTLEAVCLGIPQVVVSHSAANERSMRHLESLGAIVHLSPVIPDLPKVVLETVNNLLCSRTTMREMSEAAVRALDGKGCSRVAEILENWG